MGTSFGEQVLDQAGMSISVIANPNELHWKVGGVTIAWGTVPAQGADVVWPDGIQVRAGERGLRHGQVLQEITAAGPTLGQYGPFDPAAADGRQTPPARGRTFILPTTLLERYPQSNHRGVLEGGKVFRERLIATDAVASLAAGPTFAALEAALPDLRYAR